MGRAERLTPGNAPITLFRGWRLAIGLFKRRGRSAAADPAPATMFWDRGRQRLRWVGGWSAGMETGSVLGTGLGRGFVE
jgi:hypothetical protein